MYIIESEICCFIDEYVYSCSIQIYKLIVTFYPQLLNAFIPLKCKKEEIILLSSVNWYFK